MRTALLSTALATGIALGGAPLLAAPAWAGSTPSSAVATAATPTPTPAATQDNDHTGRYGLIGLSGLLGLFGYKKYQDLRTSRTSSRGGPIGGVDIDGSGSRRV
jgi:hypothetical protein